LDLIGLMMARYIIGAEPLAPRPPDAVVACIAWCCNDVRPGRSWPGTSSHQQEHLPVAPPAS